MNPVGCPGRFAPGFFRTNTYGLAGSAVDRVDSPLARDLHHGLLGAPPLPVVLDCRRVSKGGIPVRAGDDLVADRVSLTHHQQRPPQSTYIRFRIVVPVPVIHSPIEVVIVVR